MIASKHDGVGSEDIESHDFTMILKCHIPTRFPGSTWEENLSSDFLSRFPFALSKHILFLKFKIGKSI